MRSARLGREHITVRAMVRIYCRHHHKSGGLCSTCAPLLEYTLEKIDECRFGSRKPVCSRCPVHCYREPERTRIRQVMRYAGPRMLLYHPLLSFIHLVDRFRYRN